MKATLEKTDRTTMVFGVECEVWEGRAETGERIAALVAVMTQISHRGAYTMSVPDWPGVAASKEAVREFPAPRRRRAAGER